MTINDRKYSSVFKSAGDVADWRMCVGCGACAYACPNEKIQIVDLPDQGLRPLMSEPHCADDGQCRDCLDVCPGIDISHDRSPSTVATVPELAQSWGPVMEVWEGFPVDPEIRFSGSSAGMATALALYCIEEMGMRGALHIRGEQHSPHVNATVFSSSREQLLASTGSRYAPAAPCSRLDAIETAGGPSVFIGKPCDVEALRKAQGIRPELDRNVGAAIGIFCAGTPSTQGTLDLLDRHGVSVQDVEEIRYRGRGWPGHFAVRMKGDAAWRNLATYAEAWGFLQAYRPYRCYLCPDGTSEFADISCGDPWYREVEPGEEGTSLVVVRTAKGREVIQRAIASGAVQLKRVPPSTLAMSQRELHLKRGAIWGRVSTLRALAVPSPRFAGFSLFRSWLQIPLSHKARSIVGTIRRIFARRYYRKLDASQALAAADASMRSIDVKSPTSLPMS
jgi:coenzyme F420 hydrogenase subunit beta